MSNAKSGANQDRLLSELSNANQDRLLLELGSYNPRVRKAALRQARKLTPSELMGLLHSWEARYKRTKYVLWGVIFGLVFVAVLVTYWLSATNPGLTRYSVLGMFLPMFLGAIPSPTRRSLADLLQETDDPAFVDVGLSLLAEAHVGDTVLATRKTVMRLLPRVSLEQASRWTDVQRRALTYPLQVEQGTLGRSGDAVVVLKFLEQAGDERELPLVQKLAAWNPKNSVQREVQQAAQECLSYLVQGKRTQTQTLLRASDATTRIAPETLLRAASAEQNTTPADQLLRPR